MPVSAGAGTRRMLAVDAVVEAYAFGGSWIAIVVWNIYEINSSTVLLQ